MRQEERMRRVQWLRSVARKVTARDVAALLDQYADEMAYGPPAPAPARVGDRRLARLA